VTLIFTDVLKAITQGGEVLTILDDSMPETKKKLFDAYENHCFTPEILAGKQKMIHWKEKR